MRCTEFVEVKKDNIIISLIFSGFLIFGLIFLYSYYKEKKLEANMISFVKKYIEEEAEITVEQFLYEFTALEGSESYEKLSKSSSEKYRNLIRKRVSDILYPEKIVIENNTKKLTEDEDEEKLKRFIDTLDEGIIERIIRGAFFKEDLAEMIKEKTDSMILRMKLFIRIYSLSTSLLFLFLGIIFLKFIKKRKRLLTPLILLMISILFLSIQYFYSQEWFFKAIIDETLAIVLIFYHFVIASYLVVTSFIKEE